MRLILTWSLCSAACANLTTSTTSVTTSEPWWTWVSSTSSDCLPSLLVLGASIAVLLVVNAHLDRQRAARSYRPSTVVMREVEIYMKEFEDGGGEDIDENGTDMFDQVR